MCSYLIDHSDDLQTDISRGVLVVEARRVGEEVFSLANISRCNLTFGGAWKNVLVMFYQCENSQANGGRTWLKAVTRQPSCTSDVLNQWWLASTGPEGRSGDYAATMEDRGMEEITGTSNIMAKKRKGINHDFCSVSPRHGSTGIGTQNK